MRASSPEELEAFLAGHEPVGSGAAFKPGDEFGEWRIAAFAGKGGNGEVYRAVHAELGTEAALKVLMKDGAEGHFRQEAKLLSGINQECFPRFYSFGEVHGHLYYTMEWLEPVTRLPKEDGKVAELMIAVSKAVAELHRRGLAHRDIKPKNIMFREGKPVLIDFGLVERIGTQVAKGEGTRQYAAPEQFSGGEVSEANDIHALGVLANGCFEGNPPPEWARIISRATSSILDRRYQTVTEFILAITQRNRSKRLWQIAAMSLALGAAFLGIYGWHKSRDPDKLHWRNLCHVATTNLVARELVYERWETNKVGNTVMALPAELRYRNTTNEIRETVIELAKGSHSFLRPINLPDGNYRVKGPGRLTAEIIGSGNVTMRLDNCEFDNLTMLPPPENNIRYIAERGSRLNFANLDENRKVLENMAIPDASNAEVRFRGQLSSQDRRKKALEEASGPYIENMDEEARDKFFIERIRSGRQ